MIPALRTITAPQWLLLGAVVIALAFSFDRYVLREEYSFLVEAPCQSSSDCYTRDCDEEECPPNELETYRLFAVPARAFDTCEDNSCANVCPGTDCEELKCSDQEEIACME